MPTSLDYVRPQTRDNSHAWPACFLGIFSGPAALALILLGGILRLTESVFVFWVTAALVIGLGGPFVFGCVVRYRMPIDTPTRHKLLAAVGVLAPIGWIVVIVVPILIAMHLWFTE